jgi:hypothetical protein
MLSNTGGAERNGAISHNAGRQTLLGFQAEPSVRRFRGPSHKGDNRASCDITRRYSINPDLPNIWVHTSYQIAPIARRSRETNTSGGRTGHARWTEKSRPEAGGTKTGLAFREWGGRDYAGAFFHRDDLVGGDILDGLIALTAGPSNHHPNNAIVVA